MVKVSKAFIGYAVIPLDLSFSFNKAFLDSVAMYQVPPVHCGPEVSHVFQEKTQNESDDGAKDCTTERYEARTPVTYEQACAWLEGGTLLGHGPLASRHFADFSDLDDLARTAQDIVDFSVHDGAACGALLDGDPHKALSMVPARGYPETSERFDMSYEYAKDIIVSVTGYSSTREYLGKGHDIERRLHEPTGHPELDNDFTGPNCLIHGVCAKIAAQIRQFAIVQDLYRRTAAGDLQPMMNLAGLAPFASVDVFTNEKEKQAFLQELSISLSAHIAEQVWRRAHGNKLEAFLAMRMRQAQEEIEQLWRHVRYRQKSYNKLVHMANARGRRPMLDLLLATNAFYARCAPYGKKKQASTGCRNAIEEALIARRDGKPIPFSDMRDTSFSKLRRQLGLGSHPPRAFKRDQVEVRSLLFLMRETVLKKRIHTVVQAVQLADGSLAVDAYDVALAAKRKLQPHAGKEPFSTEITGTMNKMIKRHYVHPNRHSNAAVRYAEGRLERAISGDVLAA